MAKSGNKAVKQTAKNTPKVYLKVAKPSPSVVDQSTSTSTSDNAAVLVTTADIKATPNWSLLSIEEQEAYDEYLSYVPESKDEVHKMFINEAIAEVRSACTTIMRPKGSILTRDKAFPSAFMQHNSLFIDGVNIDISKFAEHPFMWWQPVTNPAALELARTFEFFKTQCVVGNAVDFMGLTNQIGTGIKPILSVVNR